MRINNAAEFYLFVRDKQLFGIAPEIAPMIVCIDELNKMCPCDSAAMKDAKRNQCRSLYIAFTSKASQYKNILFSKIGDSSLTFCVDGQQIITLNR